MQVRLLHTKECEYRCLSHRRAHNMRFLPRQPKADKFQTKTSIHREQCSLSHCAVF